MQHGRWQDPLGSSASGCNSEPDIEMQYGAGRYHSSDCDMEDDETFISFTTTEAKCEQLFEQGLELRLREELDRALHCFLECLKGMQECQYFAKLPQTLHQLGELYNTMGHYDKAVEFVQAEKLFYEAVIVDTAASREGEQRPRTKRKPFSKKPHSRLESRRGSNPAEYGDLLIKKAEEFDKLSRICAQEKNFDLALDYCGKAAKVRQSVFGADHPATVATLEYFTVLYAEVGRVEYVNALNSMNSDGYTDNSPVRGDLSQAKELTAPTDTEQDTHVPIHDTNAELQSNYESKHTVQPSGCNALPIQDESGSCGPKVPEHSLSIDPVVHSVEETGPLIENSGSSKQETLTHTTFTEVDSIPQTFTFEGQGPENGPKSNLLQPANNIQGKSKDIQSKQTINPLSGRLHSIHKELNAIKEFQGCGVVWQNENRGIEQARCLPLWVLLLGAFIEMALLAYFLCLQ